MGTYFNNVTLAIELKIAQYSDWFLSVFLLLHLSIIISAYNGTYNYQFLTQQPGVTLKHTKEGTESSSFWFALGGKQNYSSKKVVQDIIKDPHLYTISLNKGWFFFPIKNCFHYLYGFLYNHLNDNVQLHHCSTSLCCGPDAPGKFEVCNL